MTILNTENFASPNAVLGEVIDIADVVFTDSLSSPTYVADLQSGGFAAKVEPVGSGTGHFRHAGWLNTGKHLTRFLLRVSALPAADCIICRIDNGTITSGQKGGDLVLQANGHLRIRNASTTVATSALTVALNTTYAVEWLVDPAANTQTLRIFTDTGQSATPVETISGAYTNVEQLTQLMIGKMSGTTWAGGLTFDGYKRGDDWWASAVSALWDEEFAGFGAAGSNITTDSNIVSVAGTPPVVAAGGYHTDQKWASFGAGISNDRELESNLFASGTTQRFERLYMMVPVAPVDVTERTAIWRTTGAGGTASFTLCVAPHAEAGKATLELWKEIGWTDPVNKPEELLGEADIPINQGIRLDFEMNDLGSNLMDLDVKVWAGLAKHLTGTPTTVLAGQVTVGGIRKSYIGQRGLSGQNKVQVFFDSWVGRSDAAPGPIDESVQFEEPVGQQWAAFEWADPIEIPLNVSVWDGTQENPINIGATEEAGKNPVDPGDKLFTADPGLGSKLYVGVDTFGSGNRYDLMSDLFNFEMRTLSAGTGHPASNRCAPGAYRGFYGSSGGINAHPNFDLHTANPWSTERKAAANMAISSWSYDADPAKCLAIINGDHDTWIENELAPFITDVYERYGHLYTIDLGNESDAWTNAPTTARNPLWHHRARQACRYLHFKLLSEDVPVEAFMVTVATITQASSYQHPTRHTKPITTVGPDWPPNGAEGDRGDALYYYIPDWKETRTTTGGYWSDAYDPNPVDFIQPGEMDEWGYGEGPIHRMWQHNFYERGYEWGGGWNSVDDFKFRIVSRPGGYPFDGNLYRFNKALYGGPNPVLPVHSANANGLPVFIGEMGLGVMVQKPSTENDTQPKVTADVYCETLIPDLVENCNVVAYCKWRHSEASYNNAPGADGGTYINHWKVGQGGQAGTGRYDPLNANTKAEASLFNTDYVADPPEWPDGTPRPPYVSLSGGSKRDYRRFDDVP